MTLLDNEGNVFDLHGHPFEHLSVTIARFGNALLPHNMQSPRSSCVQEAHLLRAHFSYKLNTKRYAVFLVCSRSLAFEQIEMGKFGSQVWPDKLVWAFWKKLSEKSESKKLRNVILSEKQVKNK